MSRYLYIYSITETRRAHEIILFYYVTPLKIKQWLSSGYIDHLIYTVGEEIKMLFLICWVSSRHQNKLQTLSLVMEWEHISEICSLRTNKIVDIKSSAHDTLQVHS